MNSCEIPNLFKHGLITPIYKGQDKPIEMPNSYRRITVASNLGQVIEKVHFNLEISEDEILPHQNPLQRGFTSGISPSNGSLLLTQVKWHGEISSSFNDTLGVMQRGIWSPTAYIFFVNPVLNTVRDHSVVFHILWLDSSGGRIAVPIKGLYRTSDSGEHSIRICSD